MKLKKNDLYDNLKKIKKNLTLAVTQTIQKFMVKQKKWKSAKWKMTLKGFQFVKYVTQLYVICTQ